MRGRQDFFYSLLHQEIMKVNLLDINSEFKIKRRINEIVEKEIKSEDKNSQLIVANNMISIDTIEISIYKIIPCPSIKEMMANAERATKTGKKMINSIKSKIDQLLDERKFDEIPPLYKKLEVLEREFSDLQPINAIEGLPEINVEASFEQKKIQELQDKIDDLLSKGDFKEIPTLFEKLELLKTEYRGIV